MCMRMSRLTRIDFPGRSWKAEVGLVYLPDDIFDDMSSLTVLHLGTQLALPRLPSFKGLENLKLFAVSGALSLTELPSFDNLGRLERLVIAIAPLIEILPDFSAVTNLKSFITMDRGTWCCNGFLGQCDLTNPLCGIHPLWGTPAATCVPANRTASAATLKVAARFTESICGGLVGPNMQPDPTEDTMALCNGILYHECQLPGFPQAICYNARFMGIACTPSPFPIEMRRRQIRQGAGESCNPKYEAWLGCK
ncbi:unnamed protein product [Phytophthora lilii]|uniref:Unnamed protein product n=1 Tax=Phytophthora lilii TaxID=2077276 RepID=A0A9W6TZ68_9STRA|nr:unnamed protein product [Phytophthora lilii]